MIAILDHLELYTEVSDAGMEIIGSNDCRKLLENNGNTNSILATMQEGARFSYKDR